MNTIRKRINWPALVLLAAFAILLSYQAGARNRVALPSGPAVVATVNLETVYRNLDERADAEARLTATAEELEKVRLERRSVIDLLFEDLQLYQPGSPEYNSIEEQIQLDTLKLKAYLDFATRKLDLERSEILHRIYGRIKATIRRMASANGLDLVVVDDSVAQLPPSAQTPEQEMMRQISARRILFSGTQIDITQDLITEMNQDFSARQGG